MVKNKTQLGEVVKKFVEKLTKNVEVKMVILYGSYASGNPGTYSDIDIAVISDDFGNNRLEEMQLLSRLTLETDVDIEPLAFSYKEYLNHSKADFIHEIVSKGKIIYKDGKMNDI